MNSAINLDIAGLPAVAYALGLPDGATLDEIEERAEELTAHVAHLERLVVTQHRALLMRLAADE